MPLDLGDSVPNTKLPSSSGKEVALTDFKGKKIVLYFYPKDNTTGCTAEACDFRDATKAYTKLNAVIVGVSKDSLKSHSNFISKYQLPFELLADENAELLEAFGVWKEKSMYGRKYMGVERSTFLIDEKGEIVQVWRKVSVKDHAKAVLEEIAKL